MIQSRKLEMNLKYKPQFKQWFQNVLRFDELARIISCPVMVFTAVKMSEDAQKSCTRLQEAHYVNKMFKKHTNDHYSF